MRRAAALAALPLGCMGCSVVGGTLGAAGEFINLVITLALMAAPFVLGYYYHRRNH